MKNSDIMARADELAVVHSPSAVARSVGEFLENAFFGFFRTAGWLAGRAWFLVFVILLALKDGFNNGRPVKVPSSPAPLSAQGKVELMDAERTIDAYQTPFGVPYGPNVHASHD